MKQVKKKPAEKTESNFIILPMHIRLKWIEILVYMSDYSQAEDVVDLMINDFISDRDDDLLQLDPVITIKFIELVFYVLEKTKRWAEIIDFMESILSNEDIM